MMLADGGHAFSSSSIVSPRTKPLAKSAATKNNGLAPMDGFARNRKRHHQASPSSPTTLQALPGTFKAASSAVCFAPPVANIALKSLTAISALTATITGGVFAGSLHAIAGPDHLAALIPRCCGLPWYRAARVGAVWGMGHGVSATILGFAGYLFKRGVSFGLGGEGGINFDVLHHAGSFMELAIGASLVVIGLLGIKEAREWEADPADACEVVEGEGGGGGGVPKSLSAAAVPAAGPNPAKRAVLFNGILHGFSWDGAPSLAPAVAISTWRGSLTFLLSYAVGTMAAMALATTVIGEGTRRAAGKLDRPDLPRDLSVVSSFLALAVGVVWCGLALR